MKDLLCEYCLYLKTKVILRILPSHKGVTSQFFRFLQAVHSANSVCSSLNTVTLDTGHKTCQGQQQQKSQDYFFCGGRQGFTVEPWLALNLVAPPPPLGVDYRCVPLCLPSPVSWVGDLLKCQMRMQNCWNLPLLKFFPNKSLKVTKSRSSFGELIF